MKDRIINALKKSNTDNYRINITQKKSSEMFFVKKSLDMVRKTETTKCSVTIFRDFEKDGNKYRGHAISNIYEGMTDNEIAEAIENAYVAAGYVLNPAYSLKKGQREPLKEVSLGMNAKGHEEASAEMAKALYAEDNDSKTFINSAELFVDEITEEIITSQGTDVSYHKWKINGEYVIQSILEKDVETHQSFSYDGPEAAALRAKVKNAIEYTKARSVAKRAPQAGEYRVIISGPYMKTLYGYFLSKASAQMIYAKYSAFEVGKKIREANGLCARLIADVPYSSEGIPMEDRSFITDGVLNTIFGATRFSSYLGIEPLGNYEDFRIEPGKRTLEEMKKEPYLHVVNFSDFQMDEFTGHFGGEIRLGFLFDGEKITPVSGGSINGSIFECCDDMELCSDMMKEDGYEGPMAVAIGKVPVAGE